MPRNTIRTTPSGKREKLCTGPKHPSGGAWLPLDQFYFHKTGRDKGKPRSYCKSCNYSKCRPYQQKAKEHRYVERARKEGWRYHGYVPFAKVEFAVKTLYRILRSYRKVARATGVAYYSAWRWVNTPPERIKKEYAARLLQALMEVRNEKNDSQKT